MHMLCHNLLCGCLCYGHVYTTHTKQVLPTMNKFCVCVLGSTLVPALPFGATLSMIFWCNPVEMISLENKIVSRYIKRLSMFRRTPSLHHTQRRSPGHVLASKRKGRQPEMEFLFIDLALKCCE